MSNLYYRNLPGIEKESQATAIEINSRKSIQTFLNYYHNYRTHEEKKVIKIKLIYKDWDDFFELQNFEEAEKKFIKRRKSDLDKVPQELKELRQLKKFQIEGRGLYEIEIIDDKIEDNQVISDLVSEKKVSFSPNIRYDKFENLDYVSKRYEIVIMKISYDDKGNPKKGLNVYYKPNVRQINLIINTLMKLKDTPGRHNRELLRLFEDRNKTRFNQIVRAKLQESDWLFLTDNTRAGNQEQREFVQIAMETPDFAILDGPPGSGKTTTILELIYQLISRDQKVLLVGSTHVAVDNVIEKLMDPLFPAKDKINKLFLPIRVGDPDRHPISDFASDYTLTNIWNAKKVEQIKSLRAISNKTNSQIEWEHLLSSKGESKSIQNTILRTNSLTCGTTVGVTTHSLIVESNISNKNKPLFNYLILDEASKTTFQEFLIPGLYAEKFIIIGDVNQLSPFVDENGLSLNIGDISLFPNNERFWKVVLSNLEIIKGNPKRALIICDETELDLAFSMFKASKFFTTTLTSKFNSQIIYADVILTTMDVLKRNQNFIPSTISYFLDATIQEGVSERNTNFIFIYDVRIFSNHFRNKLRFAKDKNFIKVLDHRSQDDNWEQALSWRMIRLNEVSQIDNKYKKELENKIINLLPNDQDNRKKIEEEFADMYQITLPSILQLLQEGLKLPLFRPRADIPTTLSDGLPSEILSDRYVKLQYQHRMHPDISAFARSQFYQYRALINSNILNRELAGYDLYKNRLIWLDVVNNDSSNKMENSAEIKQIMNEIDKLVLYLKNYSNRVWEIAILTFYKQQRRKMYSMFDTSKNFKKFRSKSYYPVNCENISIKIDVVDSFQGHEADFVYLSMVRNGGVGFMDNPNRLNVALTRAKYQLVIVGDNRHFSTQKRSEHLNALASIRKERGISR